MDTIKYIGFKHILTAKKDIEEIKRLANKRMHSRFENFDPVITSVSSLAVASQEDIDSITRLLVQGRKFNKIVIIQLDADLSMLKETDTFLGARKEKFIKYVSANCMTL